MGSRLSSLTKLPFTLTSRKQIYNKHNKQSICIHDCVHVRIKVINISCSLLSFCLHSSWQWYNWLSVGISCEMLLCTHLNAYLLPTLYNIFWDYWTTPYKCRFIPFAYFLLRIMSPSAKLYMVLFISSWYGLYYHELIIRNFKL